MICPRCKFPMDLKGWWECWVCDTRLHLAACGPYAYGDDVYADCVCGLGPDLPDGCECGQCSGAGHDSLEVTV